MVDMRSDNGKKGAMVILWQSVKIYESENENDLVRENI